MSNYDRIDKKSWKHFYDKLLYCSKLVLLFYLKFIYSFRMTNCNNEICVNDGNEKLKSLEFIMSKNLLEIFGTHSDINHKISVLETKKKQVSCFYFVYVLFTMKYLFISLLT